MRPIRIYADTSVYGGVFDDEFARPSRMFFDQVEEGRFLLVLSGLVLREIQNAPERVRDLADHMLSLADVVESSAQAEDLQQAYIAAGIVGPKYLADALHVALASVSGCQAIVSWNYRHIVHFDKIYQYNEVNLTHGLESIAIHTPLEVISHEE